MIRNFRFAPMLLLLGVVFLNPVFSESSFAQKKQFSTIVIDPGHGGKDPGALGKKSKEKTIVLDVAVQLGKMIKDSLPELKTVFTRDKDVFVPLDKRAEIANKNSADLFISIHANASNNKAIRGAESFVLGLHRSKDNLEVAKRENSVITMEDEYTNKYEGFDPSQPESYIIFELMQNVYLEQSISVASLCQNALVSAQREDRGVRQAGFLVLRQTSMPSVLVELGFISNLEDEAYMNSKEGQAEMVYALFKSIRAYKSLYDKINNVSLQEQKTKVAKPAKENVAREVDLWPAGVTFRVQIAASKQDKKFGDLKWTPLSVANEDGTNKYMVGLCRTFEEAEELLKSVKNEFPDCFLVAYDGKEKISLRAAKKKVKKD